MVELDDVALGDQCGQALAEIVLIVILQAAELGHGGHPHAAQGNEGLLFAAGEIGQVHDRPRLGQGVSQLNSLPVGHASKGGSDGGNRVGALLDGGSDAADERLPGRLEEIEVLGWQAVQKAWRISGVSMATLLNGNGLSCEN